jgi:hypothetical protein
MRIRRWLFLSIWIICMHVSCIQPFAPDLEKNEELLVVDGGITDAAGPYLIKLSKSARLQEKSRFIPYPKCKVSIEDDKGNILTLSESSLGVYQTDSLVQKGVVGRNYKLHIITPEGEEYESIPEMLMKPVGIQAVYSELEHRSDPQLFYGRDGLQFYLDTERSSEPTNFLMWKLQCTYKFRTDLLIFAYYTNGKRYQVKDEDTLKFCYRTAEIPELLVIGTEQSKQPELTRVRLNYEDNYSKALSIRYSLKVQQLTISEAAHAYWSTIKKLQAMQGELYTMQPYPVKNNLLNKTHPEKPALGYFTVAGSTEKRIFVNHPLIVDRYGVCTVEGRAERDMDGQLSRRPELWPYFLVDPLENGGDHWVDQDCLDCRRTGFRERPSFWVD